MSAHLCHSDHYDLVVSIWQELSVAVRYYQRQDILNHPDVYAQGSGLNGLRQCLIQENIHSLAARYPDWSDSWGPDTGFARDQIYQPCP